MCLSRNRLKPILKKKKVNNVIKSSQLDDTAIFLKEWSVALECLHEFYLVSGLAIHINKCELFALKERPIDFCGIPIKDYITYLGITICKDQKERINLNYTPIINKIQKKCNIWLMRDLSLNGRVLLSRSEGLSRLVYTAMAIDIPKSIINEINVYFIWKNKIIIWIKKYFVILLTKVD